MSNKQPIIGQVFNNRYEIRRKLKSGGFGSVYLAKDLSNKNKYVAVKIIEAKSKFYAEIQFKMYEKFKQHNYTHGFVKHFEHGLKDDKYFIAMQLLDKDLDEVKLLAKNQCFTLKTVLMIGLQAIDRLQALHKIGYLHRDVKPDNLAIGLEEKNKIVYLIDFGLVKKIQEVRPEQKNKLMGSLGFMSCRAHEGKLTGVSDDIESLIYTMLFLLNGSLPWSKLQIKNIQEAQKILIMKKKLSKLDFKTKNIPQGLFDILNKMKSTPVNQKIDYLMVKYEMLEMLKNIKAQNDFCFDWINFKSKSPSKLSSRKQISPQRIHTQELKEKNQKEVENDIYAVYKFLDQKSGQTKEKLTNPQQKRNLKKKPVSQEKFTSTKLKQQEAKNKPIMNQMNRKYEANNRPSSAANIKKAQLKESTLKNFNKITQLYGALKYQGPNIAINMTAKHKI